MSRTDFTPDELNFLVDNIEKFPLHEQAEIRKMVETLDVRVAQLSAQSHFTDFMRAVEPTMLQGPQHRIIGKLFEKIANGTLKRLIINIAPRHSKSTMSSYLFPAWFIGKFPNKKVIMASHTGDLAVDFGRKVRNLIASEIYGTVFPSVSLAPDSKAAGRWNTNVGGEYYALGVGAAMAGRGGDLVVIDDPHSEQEAKSGNPEIFDSAYEWYQSGPRQRLQPGGAIVVLMTRWNKRDLTGRIIEQSRYSPDGDEWTVVELPAILPSGNPLWPEFWSLDELMKVKASIDTRYWQAQYMQNPISDEGAIVKREWWRQWDGVEPPSCDYIIGSLDAAAETNNRADHSSLTIWGVFYRPDEATGEEQANIILLESIRERIEYVELKDLAYKQWKEWSMDCFIVEKKSNGTPLFQEMRRSGIPVSEYTPHRGTGDKTARLNSVADIVRSGLVWYPRGRQWAEELVDEIAGFPAYGSDDRVDTTIMALMRFRNGGFIRLPSDREYDDESGFMTRTRKYY
jgi:predicted phage terminase large subunit-like protein